jgi:hypothetical protein
MLLLPGRRFQGPHKRQIVSISSNNPIWDSRRLDTLAWAVIGLCLTQTVRLSGWAEVIQSRATLAASRVRRFSRWFAPPSYFSLPLGPASDASGSCCLAASISPVSCPRYHCPHPFRIDPGFAYLSWPCAPAGLAGDAAPQYDGGECRIISRCWSRPVPSCPPTA